MSFKYVSVINHSCAGEVCLLLLDLDFNSAVLVHCRKLRQWQQLKHKGKHAAFSKGTLVYVEDATGCLSLLLYPLHIINWADQQAACRFEFHIGVLDHRSLCWFACEIFMSSMQCRVHFQWVGAVLLWFTDAYAGLPNLSCFAMPIDRCILS